MERERRVPCRTHLRHIVCSPWKVIPSRRWWLLSGFRLIHMRVGFMSSFRPTGWRLQEEMNVLWGHLTIVCSTPRVGGCDRRARACTHRNPSSPTTSSSVIRIRTQGQRCGAHSNAAVSQVNPFRLTAAERSWRFKRSRALINPPTRRPLQPPPPPTVASYDRI